MTQPHDIGSMHLVLMGAGGHGRVAADIAEAQGWGRISFLDGAYPELNDNAGWPVVGRLEAVREFLAQDSRAFVSIGANARRETVFSTLAGEDVPVLRHPSATVSRHARIGAGTFIAPGALININAVLGFSVIVNTAASIDHDCRIGDFVHVSPGASLAGNVTVGARSWIGIGAAVREGVTIGADVMVGAGAAVVSDIPDGQRVVGVPAKPV